MSCCNSNCNHDPCGSSFNQALTRAAQYAQYAQTQANAAAASLAEFNEKYLGAFAEAPAGPHETGALYWNLGNNTMYVWDGTSWIANGNFNEFTNFSLPSTTALGVANFVTGQEYEIVTVGNTNWTSIGAASATVGVRFTKNAVTATGTGTARITRDLVTRFADVVNVKDFGAVGDSVTDDTAAIQAAIDAADARGGGIVYFPATGGSFYAVKQTFTIGDKTHLLGDGSDSTHIKWTSPPPETIAYPVGIPSSRKGFTNKNYTLGNSYITIEGLKLDFSLVVGALGFARQLVYFYNCDRTIVKNCHIMSDGGSVCNVRTTNYLVSENYCQQVGTYASSDGMIDQWDGSQNGTIINNILECINLTKWAILITATDTIGNPSIRPCQNFYIANNKIRQSLLAAFSPMGRIDGCFNIVFTGNDIDGNLANTFYYGAIDIRACENVVISNNIIRNTTKAGIYFGREGAIGFYPYQNNYNINIIGNILENISVNPIHNAIEFSSSIVDKINIAGNIVDGGAYNYALAVAGGTTITNYSIQNNYFKEGVLGITNNDQLFDINWRNAFGNINATIQAANNTPNTKTKLIFFSNGFNFLNNADNPCFLVSTSATGVNRVQVLGTDAGIPPRISAEGSDTNIDLDLRSKGTGRIRFGTYVNTASAVTGYIEIKDASGQLRKLAVLAP